MLSHRNTQNQSEIGILYNLYPAYLSGDQKFIIDDILKEVQIKVHKKVTIIESVAQILIGLTKEAVDMMAIAAYTQTITSIQIRRFLNIQRSMQMNSNENCSSGIPTFYF